MLSSSRGQGNFRGLEASRPRPRTSKCVLDDVLEAKDVLEDSTSGNLFNKYFTEIGFNLASTIETTTIIDNKFTATSLIQSRPSYNSFFLELIVEEEVVNYIKGMNPSKSTGRNGIPAKYIKMSGSVIAPVLTNIFNACISAGYFPKVFKRLKLYQFLKKAKENYAVITTLFLF